eukprot:Hpha_TRINITY_DN15726_c2_g4::TRINITY_DN15726_c2_g4_i1::g.40250::m.40250
MGGSKPKADGGSAPLFDIKADPLTDREEWERQYSDKDKQMLVPSAKGLCVFDVRTLRQAHKKHTKRRREKPKMGALSTPHLPMLRGPSSDSPPRSGHSGGSGIQRLPTVELGSARRG